MMQSSPVHAQASRNILSGQGSHLIKPGDVGYPRTVPESKPAKNDVSGVYGSNTIPSSNVGGVISSIILFLSVYSVLHLTAFPSVPGGDSGELLAEACVHGVAHPPGYPLFLILSSLVAKIPLPRIYLEFATLAANNKSLLPTFAVDYNPNYAWKVNHLCCVFAAATAVLIGKLSVQMMLKLDKPGKPNIFNGALSFFIAPIMYCFSPLVWEYSVTSEVFALNNLLCISLIYVAYKIFLGELWADNSRSGFIYTLVGAFICGLSLCNQHASILYMIPLVPLIALTNYNIRRHEFWTTSVYSVMAFLLGLLPYLVLVFWSRDEMTKGSWGDLRSFNGFFRHFLRSEYGTFQLGMTKGSEGFLKRLVYYFRHSSQESFHLALPGFAIAIWKIFSRHLEIISIKGSETVPQITFKNTSHKSKHNFKKIKPILEPNAPNTSASAATASSESLSSIYVVLFAYVFYVLIWHGVFSNLPLGAPMPYGVHARFWMQPNIILCVVSALGLEIALEKVYWAVNGERDPHTISTENSSSVSKSVIRGSTLALVLGFFFNLFITSQYIKMDKSKTGWIMHQYAQLTLDSMPQDSILVSHTDLDWNTIRYLRNCDGIRPDITHLSFQIMPYPWFKDRQMHQYKDKVNFPDMTFNGVTTDRFSEGNARLVYSFCIANGARGIGASGVIPPRGEVELGGLFIDFQAVGNIGWDDLGYLWYDLLLLPWANQYRVFSSSLSFDEVLPLHVQAFEQLQRLQRGFPAIDASLVLQYPPGAWEFAAASVVTDSKYLFAIHLISFTSNKDDVNLQNIAYVVNRLFASSVLMLEVQNTVRVFGTISSLTGDIDKNSALSWMRLMSYLKVAVEIEVKKPGSIAGKDALMVTVNDYEDLLSVRKYNEICQTGIRVVRQFVEAYPKDSNIASFTNVLTADWIIYEK